MASFLKILFKTSANSEVTKLLLDSLQVKVTLSTITKEIEGHPDYPSLLSISDVLTTHGVENMSLKIESTNLEKLPFPFIAVIKESRNHKDSFTVVKSIKDQHFEYYNLQNHTWQFIKKEKFIERWPSQIALIADAENAIDENDYQQKIKEEKRKHVAKLSLYLLIPLLTLITALFAFINYGASSTLPVMFTIFTLAGCIIGGLIIWHELDEYNPALQQICSGGKKVNCGAILNSKVSKIFGLSWSVIGCTYFLGGLLLLLFSGINDLSTLFILAWINAMAAPYILFSVFYQWLIAKQWCVLCLCAQGLLALQLVIAISAGWHSAVPLQSVIFYQIFIPILLSFSIPFVVISSLIPVFRATKESKTNKHELQRLKQNIQIFEGLLTKQRHITENPNNLGISLGNSNASNKIIKVCNPYCGPCAKAHKPMEDLLDSNPDLQIQIIFTATGEEGDIQTPPVKHLLAIAQTSDNEAQIKRALDDWYLADKKVYEAFAKKHPVNGELKMQDDKIRAMRKWCDKTEIMFTPTFFVNGYQLPDIYDAGDLKYLLSI